MPEPTAARSQGRVSIPPSRRSGPRLVFESISARLPLTTHPDPPASEKPPGGFPEKTWLHRQARRLLGSRLRRSVDSTDLVHETHLRVARGPGRTFPNRAALRAWLLRILRNVVAGEGRRRRTVQWEESLGEPVARGTSPSGHAAISEEARNARALMRALPARERQVVSMRVLEDEPFAVIADRLGLTEGHARVIFHRSLQAMRRATNGHGNPGC